MIAKRKYWFLVAWMTVVLSGDDSIQNNNYLLDIWKAIEQKQPELKDNATLVKTLFRYGYGQKNEAGLHNEEEHDINIFLVSFLEIPLKAKK